MFLRRGPRHFMISIHAPREGGDRTNYHPHYKNSISIHAPREGGDLLVSAAYPVPWNISIHAPREGGDLSAV